MDTILIEKLVPDAETCIAMYTMGFRPKNTTFVWADTGLINHATEEPVYRVMPAQEAAGLCAFFAAPTADEMQAELPVNFVPMRAGKLWFIVDLYGSKMAEQKSDDKSVVAGQQTALVLSRVNGSTAETAAQAFANAIIFLIQTGALRSAGK